MLRIEVSEAGQGALPAIDVDDAKFVIGSAASARVRLPGAAAQPEHIAIDGDRWRALAPLRDRAEQEGSIGDGVTLEIGAYRVRIAPAPAGSTASPPQRTDSVARELLRSLLGPGAAATLEVERGPVVGATRKLAAPESTLVIGRGDEANWILLDEDLSRTHAEVQRRWDGTRIVDLGSKNGTKLDGTPVGAEGALLRDGCLVELGKVAFRFRDPAEQQLAATPATIVASPSAVRASAAAKPVASPVVVAPQAPSAAPPGRPSPVPFYAAVTIMFAAVAGLVWVLSL